VAITSPGIGSGLDVNGIVSKLMQVESQPLTDYAKKEASFQAQLTGYGTFKGALSSFQSALASLNSISKFQSVSASSGDTTILTASASTTAAAGSYAVNVTALAQAHTLIANGQASSTSSLGNGADTLSFQFGTSGTPASFGVAKTVTIAPNSSLQNIADSVNSANIGVAATIVNDGSAAPYRLVFASTNTGVTNSMSITATDPILVGIMNYDQVGAGAKNMTQTAAGQNAALTVNGIAVSSASNTVTGAISGVTLNAVKIGTTSVNVARDTAQVQPAIQVLVKGYNDLNKSIKDLTGYDAKSKQGGILQGDATVLSIQSQIRRTLSSALPVASGALSTLSQVGVSFQKDGTMALDATKLQSAISSNFNDIAGLFTAAGQITDSLISFESSANSTQSGTSSIVLTAMPSTGAAVGNVNLNLGNTTIAVGTALNMTLDGVTASVSLAAGSYTASQLATMIQTAVNGTSAFSSGGSSVVATVDAVTGFMSITSNRYGSASNVSLSNGTGTAVATFMGVMTSPIGVDAAGTIGGATATGSGQYLTSPDGLKIKVNGGVTGARGSINFTKGYAYQLNNLLSTYLGSTSPIDSRTSGIQRSIDSITKQTDVFNTHLIATEKRYRAQFTALDVLMSKMTQTSNFMTQQLASLTKSTSG